jgi:hypothetical protein
MLTIIEIALNSITRILMPVSPLALLAKYLQRILDMVTGGGHEAAEHEIEQGIARTLEHREHREHRQRRHHQWHQRDQGAVRQRTGRLEAFVIDEALPEEAAEARCAIAVVAQGHGYPFVDCRSVTGAAATSAASLVTLAHRH